MNVRYLSGLVSDGWQSLRIYGNPGCGSINKESAKKELKFQISKWGKTQEIYRKWIDLIEIHSFILIVMLSYLDYQTQSRSSLHRNGGGKPTKIL